MSIAQGSTVFVMGSNGVPPQRAIVLQSERVNGEQGYRVLLSRSNTLDLVHESMVLQAAHPCEQMAELSRQTNKCKPKPKRK